VLGLQALEGYVVALLALLWFVRWLLLVATLCEFVRVSVLSFFVVSLELGWRGLIDEV